MNLVMRIRELNYCCKIDLKGKGTSVLSIAAAFLNASQLKAFLDLSAQSKKAGILVHGVVNMFRMTRLDI